MKDFNSINYKPIIITIDGTAASGKGTIVKGLKKLLDNRYNTLDAGAMYRSLTYFYLSKEIDASKLFKSSFLEEKLIEDINLRLDENGKLYLNNEEMKDEYLRGPQIDPYVGKFSEIDQVKNYIIKSQKDIIVNLNDMGWILDGRCMGTAVAPQAQVKFFMDAPYLVRATRRHIDYIKLGKCDTSTEEIAVNIQRRDELDMNTKIAPLKRPNDAFDIDSYKSSPQDSINHTYKIVIDAIKENGLL